MQTLDLIVPCYNEEAYLEKLVMENILPLKEKLAADLAVALRIIIVDDASKDGSLAVAEKLARENNDWITCLRHQTNRGKGAALRTGFAAATADFVGIQDADREYDPMDYVEMLQPMLQGKADVVFGSRYLRPSTRRVLSFWHSLMNRFLTFASNMFTGLDISDMETCYKLFTKKTIREIVPQLKENRFGFEPEITAYVAQGKYRVYECAIHYNPRTYDEGKKIGYKDGIRALYCILHYGAPYAPLPMQFLLYTVIGGICAVVNLAAFIAMDMAAVPLFYSVWGSFLIAAFLNYVLCAIILFKHKARWSGFTEMLMYVFVLIVMGWSDYFITYGLIRVGLNDILSKTISTVVCFIGNFVLRKWLVFPLRKKKEK